MIISYTCQMCGKVFEHEKANKGTKTCSKSCQYRMIGNYTYNRTSKKCVRCGKEFAVPQAWLRKSGNRGKYCSKECRWSLKKSFTESEHNRARNRVRMAVRRGDLKRKPCEVCKNVNVEAHHFKGYAPEYWYDVQWLCDKHHNQAHERMRESNITLS